MLDPKVLSSIADLELVARVIVDGTVSGFHRSPFHGYSAEFSQYRHYQPGDDLRYVDWKLFARTDRVFTKQYRETTNMPAHFAIDSSRSMDFRGQNGVSKFEYARVIAAALAYLVASQGDAVGLALYDERLREHAMTRSGSSHLRRVLGMLAAARPTGGASIAAALRRAIDLLTRRGVLVVLSDLYEDGDDVYRELRRAAGAGHEVALFHVLSRDEVAFPYGGDIEFEDLENGRRVLTNGEKIASAYRAAVSEFIERWRSRSAADGIAYATAITDMPPDEVLRTYLLKRSSARAR